MRTNWPEKWGAWAGGDETELSWEGPPAGTIREGVAGHPCSPARAPSGGHPADPGFEGRSDRVRTFLVSGGTESLSFGGCLVWLGFWACLLQARGFVGSPNDLQNSTCTGEGGWSGGPATAPATLTPRSLGF